MESVKYGLGYDTLHLSKPPVVGLNPRVTTLIYKMMMIHQGETRENAQI
jgi:hypothetical protein